MASKLGLGPGGAMDSTTSSSGRSAKPPPSGDAAALRALIDDEHPADIGAALEEFEPHHVWAMLDLLPLEEQAGDLRLHRP
jgi:hypothetical protein